MYSSVNVVQRCILVSLNAMCGCPQHSAPSHVPCRADAKQDYEGLGLGTPPTLLRQNSLGRPPSSTGRQTDDEGSLRRRAVKVGKNDRHGNFHELFLSISAYVLI